MRIKILGLAAVAALVGSWAVAGEPIRWLNVNVTDRNDKTEVKLHVPFSLVLTAVDAVNTEGLRDGKVSLHMDHCDVNWVAVVKELQRAPEGDYLTVEQPDAHVVMGKRDGVVTVDVQESGEHGEHVKVRLPEPLLSALVVDDQNRLDVRALFSKLQEANVGELLRVEADDADVRVWLE